jgi:hypothetical protein
MLTIRKPGWSMLTLTGIGGLMNKATEYRGIAAKFRDEACRTLLPQQRQLALQAAERWEFLAEELEAAIASSVALGGRPAKWAF